MKLPEQISKMIADELEQVGDFGRVTLHVSNGSINRVEGTRSRLVIDESLQIPLAERRREAA